MTVYLSRIGRNNLIVLLMSSSKTVTICSFLYSRFFELMSYLYKRWLQSLKQFRNCSTEIGLTGLNNLWHFYSASFFDSKTINIFWYRKYIVNCSNSIYWEIHLILGACPLSKMNTFSNNFFLIQTKLILSV